MLASEGIGFASPGSTWRARWAEVTCLWFCSGVMVEDDQAHSAQQLIAAYNAALPLPGDNRIMSKGTLLC